MPAGAKNSRYLGGLVDSRSVNNARNYYKNNMNPSAFVMAIGAIGPALGIGLIGYAACKGIARNPQAASSIQIMAIISIAFAEAIAIYALVVALILKFVG